MATEDPLADILSAQDEQALMNALFAAAALLRSNPATLAATPKQRVIEVGHRKRQEVGPAVWTPAVAQHFGQLLSVYARPVAPAPAYPGQTMPPDFCFVPPPPAFDDAPGAGQGQRQAPSTNAPVQATLVSEPSFLYAPPSGAPPPFALPVSVPVVAASAVQQGPAPGQAAEPFVMAVPLSCEPTPVPARAAVGAGAGTGVDQQPLPQARIVPHATEAALAERTRSSVDGDLRTTALPRQAQDHEVTHLNLWHNDIVRIVGLQQFPNLMRLTLKSNDLVSLDGIQHARFLRWIDASDNDLEDLSGMAHMQSLQWLDLHGNNLESLRGLSFCPALTFLNLRTNNLTSVIGIETLPALQWLDVSDNNLQHVQGAERCAALRHLDVTNNDISAMGPGQNSLVFVASNCRMLQVLRCGRNSIDVNMLTQHFAANNPQCRVDTSGRISSSGSGSSSSSSSGCCTIM